MNLELSFQEAHLIALWLSREDIAPGTPAQRLYDRVQEAIEAEAGRIRDNVVRRLGSCIKVVPNSGGLVELTSPNGIYLTEDEVNYLLAFAGTDPK